MPYLTIRHKQLYYEWWGRGTESASDTPVIVLLHEGLGCIPLWKGVPEQLAEATQMPVFAYERQGYGLSDAMDLPRPMDYLEREAWDWLPEVLAAAGIGNPILFGHSDGGSIALLYAARFSVRGIVIESAHVLVEAVTWEGVKAARAAYPHIRERLYRYHGDKTDNLFYAWADTWLDERFRDWNIEQHLAAVRCPALILQGENDEYATPSHVDRIVAGLGSQQKSGALIPNSAHIPHLQANAETMEAIISFILQWGRGALSI